MVRQALDFPHTTAARGSQESGALLSGRLWRFGVPTKYLHFFPGSIQVTAAASGSGIGKTPPDSVLQVISVLTALCHW